MKYLIILLDPKGLSKSSDFKILLKFESIRPTKTIHQ
jgi:hypothetical protein